MAELPLPTPLPGVIDTHCHLETSSKADRPTPERILDRARASGVVGFVVIGVGETTAQARHAVSLARAHRDVVASVGLHPHDAKEANEAMLSEIEALARDDRVTAVGEIGLDFHYDHSPRDVQRDVFREMIALARRVKKPIVIHTREAGQETLDVLESEGARDVGGVIHCFSEDLAFAKRAVEIDFDLSFSGIVTFKTAAAVQEVAKWAPRDRVLVETDAPYLAPVPMRGKICEPAMVVHTARFVAQLRGTTPEEIAIATSENARRRFAALRSTQEIQ